MVFQGVFGSPSLLIQYGTDQLEAANKSEQSAQPETKKAGHQAKEVLRRPPPGMMKCNWDAALDLESKRMGVGIVIRNHEGMVIATKCSTRPHIIDPLIAEAVAVWEAGHLVR